MKTRIRFLLAAILGISLNACQENGEPPTASQPTITLAPRLTLSQGADTALYNSTANVLVHLDAGTVHRDTLVAFSLHRCLFEGLNPNVGFSLSFRGLNAKGDTLWRGTRSGVTGKDLSSGTTNQAVDVPVQFADKEPPKFLSVPADSIVRSGVGQIYLDWFVRQENGLSAAINGITLSIRTNGAIHATMTLQEGANRFVLTVRDSTANAVSDTVWVTRKAVVVGADTSAPVLLFSPADTSVSSSVSGLSLHWLVASEPGLTATLDGAAAVVHGDTIRGSVALAEGVTHHVLKVSDTLGNERSDTAAVTRTAPSDKDAPILLQSPKDSIVPNSTNTMTLSWKIQIEPSLTARLDGTLLTGAAGVYTKQVGLAEGANHFVFVALDSAGNSIVDTVWITREPVKDVDAPLIIDAPHDTVVTDSVKTFTPRWKVRLEPKMYATINGLAISDSAGIFKREIVLDSPFTQTVLALRDSLGNERQDTMRVTRAAKAGFSTIPWNPVMIYGSLVDDRDGQAYKIIGIGSQMWMAENLNYSGGGSIGKCYENSADSCAKYGRLYSWDVAMQVAANNPGNGLCPTSWHVPSDAEWDTLMTAVGGTATAGAKLKSIEGWSYLENNVVFKGNGTDSYGFRALPAGIITPNGTFASIGNYNSWWSATESNGTYTKNRILYGDRDDVYSNVAEKLSEFPLRCIRNKI